MAEENEIQNLEQNQKEKPISFVMNVVITGFIGGLLWSGIAYFAYLFHFTTINPNIIFEPWAVGGWKDSWIGYILALVGYGMVSSGAALVYYGLLRKLKSMWVGAAYGIGLFLAVVLILNPLFKSMKGLTEMELNTLITCVCVYVLYGVFIGFSISYEEEERKKQERQERQGSEESVQT
ncbi:YqhR family membrane protein [Bacillus sp. 2205SS5-2]|uniref:YqhR family membrane protein n=1 Tax=Bacillus sp. 2205SS5-2 TaxID=3109031 RepID=UPI003007B256